MVDLVCCGLLTTIVDGPLCMQDPLNHLYEVGTFAQVHTILTGESLDSGQLLLLGHRRVRRTEMVRRLGVGSKF